MQGPTLLSYEIDTSSPYYRELLPDAFMDPLFDKFCQNATQLMCKFEPANVEVFKKLYEDVKDDIHPHFKKIFKDLFAGIADTNSPVFQQVFRSVFARPFCYLRFLKDRQLARDELATVKINNPLFIIGVPRSGSTFLHSLLSTHPHAKTIAMYEHLSSGCKTMQAENRIKYASFLVNPFREQSVELEKIHIVDNVKHAEEELVFMEMCGHSMFIGSAIPRLEQMRADTCNSDLHWLYELLADHLRFHIMEHPMGENDFLCLKTVSHFISMQPFFDTFGPKEMGSRIVWLHRDPIDSIKSCIPLLQAIQPRYDKDIGIGDLEWLNMSVIRMYRLMLNNAIYHRQKWIAEHPDQKDQIIDVGFKNIIKNPIETVQSIYNHFGIEVTPEIIEGVQNAIDNDRQEKAGRKKKDSKLYIFNDEDVRKEFAWYYEMFADYL